MNLIKVNGIVLKRTNVFDNDAILTIFSDELGIIKASARGVKSLKSKLFSGCALFSYSEFVLKEAKDMYKISSATLIESFYSLSTNIERIAFATYLADITAYIMMNEIPAKPLLRLLLNTFYLLANSDKNKRLIKCIYELKLLNYAGLEPQVRTCTKCGLIKELNYFSPAAGGLVCNDCTAAFADNHFINEPALIAMRYILFEDDKKAFSFILSDNALSELEAHIESFMKHHVDRDFYSLEYLNTILGK